MVSGHHIRLIQVSNFLDLNIYAKTPWGPRVQEDGQKRKMVIKIEFTPLSDMTADCTICPF